MTHTRRFGALLALILILVLAACSSPDDFNEPTELEPQFGNGWDNIGIDVTSPFAGRVYVLSQDESYYESYDEYYDESFYSYNSDLIISRYDGSGTLIWSRPINSFYCDQDDYFDAGCGNDYVKPLSLHADKNGYGYSFFMVGENNDYSSDDYMVYKTDSQGRVVKIFALAEGAANYSDYYAYTTGPKLAVDTSGNMIYARTEWRYAGGNDAESPFKIISGYNTSGTPQWQRTLPSATGTPTGVAVSGSNIYVVGTSGYAKYTSSGNLVWSKTGSGNDITVAGSYFYIRRGSAVLKYDSNGKLLWSKTQSGLSSPVYGEMTGDTAGNVYLSGKYAASSSNRNGFVRKLNSSGTVVWTKTNVASTSAYDDVRGITSVSGSEIYITGETQGSLAHSNRGGDNNRDGYVRELSSSGSTAWTK